MRLNPNIWGQVEEVELSPLEAKLKATAMVPFIAEDVHQAARLFGVFEAWHWLPEQQTGLLGDLQEAVKLNILLCLARLFEFGTTRGFSQDSRDIASLPFLVRLMSDAEVQELIAAQASTWNDASLADETYDIALDAFAQASDALQEFENSVFASACLQGLRQTRNSFIAHRLIEEKKPFQMLSVEDVRFLLHAAIAVFSPLELAITGEEPGYLAQQRQSCAEAKALLQTNQSADKERA